MPIRALLPENPKIATSAPSSGAQLYAQIPLLAHLYSNHYEMLGMDGNRPPGKALDAPINGATIRLDDRPAFGDTGLARLNRKIATDFTKGRIASPRYLTRKLTVQRLDMAQA